MNRYFRDAWCLVTAAGLLLPLAGCKRKSEAVKSDLSEAGYALTAEEWCRASRENDVAALKKFVAGGYALDTKNAAGDTALHAAAGGGAEAAADFLLDRRLPVDVRGANERTPLMTAVMADQTAMVRWLLKQGADAKLKDQEGFRPMMLAVREGRSGSVGELAAYDREELDPALLLAALVGRADVIDALTNYGASVFARMEDGRTPLMIAAENGHAEAVTLLLEIGASRFTTDPEGRTAADIATAAGHAEIAEMISREPTPTDLALDSPEQVAVSLDAAVDQAVAKSAGKNERATPREASRPLGGEVLSRPVSSDGPGKSGEAFSMPPLVMRHYREKEVPVRVKTVQGETATLSIAGAAQREVKVRAGDEVPGSNLVVVKVRRRMEDSKLSTEHPAEISVVEVRDRSTGKTREWTAGVASSSHDPVALVEDSASGKRYVAAPGQRFTSADGTEYLVSDVRPNQMIIQEVASGAVRTIPLRGPRG